MCRRGARSFKAIGKGSVYARSVGRDRGNAQRNAQNKQKKRVYSTSIKKRLCPKARKLSVNLICIYKAHRVIRKVNP